MGSIIAQGECRGQACLPMTEPQQELLGQRPSSLPPTQQCFVSPADGDACHQRSAKNKQTPALMPGLPKNGDSRSKAGMASKGIKREVACELAFDTRSSQAPLGE